jgi:lysyl-tRNA synthetase class 2
MPATAQMARARSRLARALRDGLEARGYLEVETPIAVPFAGQEPHLRPFETVFTPDPPSDIEEARRLHLHTSPEYAMKRVLAREGFSRCYQLARVFRDGEASRTHNPEFTLLELYAATQEGDGFAGARAEAAGRSMGGAARVMEDLEQLIAEGARALNGSAQAPGRRRPLSLEPPFERLTSREAFSRYAGFDPLPLDAEALSQAARAVGVRTSPGASWDDLFTQLLIDKVEPCLGIEKPTYLTEYPASQAALAKLKPAGVADRFELYAGGLELANGFSELNDSRQQRRRLLEEQQQRAALGREVFPLDEKFLAALDQMPDAGGVAVGFDRLLMLLTGAQTIAEVLLFPAAEEYPAARRAK